MATRASPCQPYEQSFVLSLCWVSLPALVSLVCLWIGLWRTKGSVGGPSTSRGSGGRAWGRAALEGEGVISTTPLYDTAARRPSQWGAGRSHVPNAHSPRRRHATSATAGPSCQPPAPFARASAPAGASRPKERELFRRRARRPSHQAESFLTSGHGGKQTRREKRRRMLKPSLSLQHQKVGKPWEGRGILDLRTSST